MYKSIGIMTHWPDRDRAHFQAYYESDHAPLAIHFFPFAKYVRNHLQDLPQLDFDTLSEFWSENFTAIGTLMAGDVGRIMREDELRFMDRDKIRSAPTAEHGLWGPPRNEEATPTTRLALLLGRDESLDDTALLQRITPWAQQAAAGAHGAVRRASVDILAPYPGTTFPYAAVLWFDLTGDTSPDISMPPAGVILLGRTRVRSCETTTATMTAARAREATGFDIARARREKDAAR
ncbi:MAG TPA: EthD domain-containing protein [Rhodocyclaceae bacterium]|nr:EthD domain-containing protein [Rhodocyclaceae bacterium]